jgi:L-ascorbate metabolism protein UlaG (beta-lactamase superfamily)
MSAPSYLQELPAGWKTQSLAGARSRRATAFIATFRQRTPLVAALAALGAVGTGLPAGSACAQPASQAVVLVEYIAHASFRVRSPQGHTVVIDPYASRVWLGYDFPAELGASTVLVTHPHYDHDGGRFRGLDVPWEPDARVIDGPGEYEVGDLAVRGIRGKHADPYGKEFGQVNTIFVLETAGIRIAHLGDNGPLTEENVEELDRVDVLMVPIDGDYHILAESEIQAILTAVRPRVLIPMHYRIPALEPEPDSPSDLGPIDPWLDDKDGVQRLPTHRLELSAGWLSQAPSIVVFAHSPEVGAPSPEGEHP